MLYWILALLFISNILTSIYIYQRNFLEQQQKQLIVLIIWLVPFIGAGGMFLVVYVLEKNENPYQSFGDDANDTQGVSHSEGGGGD